MVFISSSPVQHLSEMLPNVVVDVEKIFGLVDRILPFEACLYHEVLPLNLESRKLYLGMVTISDVAALDYVRKILSFLNYVLIPQVMPSDLHHQILSQYLQFKGQPAPIQDEEATVFYEPAEIAQCRATAQKSADRPTAASVNPSSEQISSIRTWNKSIVRPQIDRETLIVEAPEELEDWKAPTATPPIVTPPIVTPPTVAVSPTMQDATIIQRFDGADDRSPVSSSQLAPPELTPSELTLPTPGDALPVLAVKTTYMNASPEILQSLDSTELLENLLGRVLAGGIGRLYFEYQQDSGRILSSNSGVLQSMVESLPIDRFESLIWALKNLMRVSPEVVTEPLQVEIERWHEKNRLLLRLRIMPQWENHQVVGEDATLQILRGAALRFYQQQQSTQLRRDTLLVAKNLQLKVQALQNRTQFPS